METISADQNGNENLSEQEVAQLRAMIQLFPVHNHDGRNSLEVATKRVRSSITSERVLTPSDIVAGEAIANGNAVRISSASEFVILSEEAGTRINGTGLSSGESLAQSFTLANFDSTSGSGYGITGVTLYYAFPSSANKTVRVSIYNDSSGSPGSTEHAFEQLNLTDGVTDKQQRFTFSGFMPTSGTTYWIVVKAVNTNSTLSIRRLSGVNNYTNKINTGSWAADSETSDFYFQLHFKEVSENKALKATSLSSNMDELFLGIATNDAASGASVEVAMLGTKTDFTGLTTGAKYYLTDTAGTVGTAAGRFTVPIGKALSSETLFIFPPALS